MFLLAKQFSLRAVYLCNFLDVLIISMDDIVIYFLWK